MSDQGEKYSSQFSNSLLLIVDPQESFTPQLPGQNIDGRGSLAVTGGRDIYPEIISLIKFADENQIPVGYSLDLHPPNSVTFSRTHSVDPFSNVKIDGKEYTVWPPHCVAGTQGSNVCDLLSAHMKPNYKVFLKGWEKECYSPFGSEYEDTGLNAYLKSLGITDIIVVGLALDYCVKNAIISASALGYKSHLIVSGTRAVNPDNTESTINELVTSHNTIRWETADALIATFAPS
jgi:nicotinamidase-related amidase